MKYDECGKNWYKGENLYDQAVIFYFKGGYEV
jgi:hypothetical protein